MKRIYRNNHLFTPKPRYRRYYDPVTRLRLTTREAIAKGLADYSDPLVASLIANGYAKDPREEL